MFDEESLFVTLEARITEFERRMRTAERRGAATYNGLQRGSRTATRQMEADMLRSTSTINRALDSTTASIGKLRAAAASPLGLGVTAAAASLLAVGKAANEAALQIARIGDEAKRAGVSAQAFQEWSYVAAQNRIPVDALIDGLKELNLRADEFVTTGGGSAAEAFARLGYTAEELKAKLKDPSALLLEIIGRLGDLDAAAQIRVADEVFGGTAGERFVELLNESEAGIRRTIEEAHSLGIVMDDALIAKADALNARFNALSTAVGVHLKSATVEAADALSGFLGMLGSINTGPRGLGRILAPILGPAAMLIPRGGASAPLPDTEDGRSLRARGLTAAPPPQPHADPTEDSRNGWQRGVWMDGADRLRIPSRVPAATGGSAGGGGGGGAAAAPTADELQREIEMIIKRTEAIRAATEAQAGVNPLLDDYGHASEKAATAQELLTAAQEAGVALTPALMAQIDALAEGYAAASAEAKRLDEAQRDIVRNAEATAALKRDVVGGLVRGLRDGADAADLLSNALSRVADHYLDLVLQSAFQPSAAGGGFGGILGFLGGLFGRIPGFADGGTAPGGMAWVGERGRELVTLPRGARVHPHATSEAMARNPAAAPAINAKIVNVLDAADIVSEGLATEAGERVILNYITRNSRRVNAALGR